MTSRSIFRYDSLAVMLNERGRKTVLTAWRDRKQEEITHPYLGEKIQVGLIAYVQADSDIPAVVTISGEMLKTLAVTVPANN